MSGQLSKQRLDEMRRSLQTELSRALIAALNDVDLRAAKDLPPASVPFLSLNGDRVLAGRMPKEGLTLVSYTSRDKQTHTLRARASALIFLWDGVHDPLKGFRTPTLVQPADPQSVYRLGDDLATVAKAAAAATRSTLDAHRAPYGTKVVAVPYVRQPGQDTHSFYVYFRWGCDFYALPE